MNKPSYQELNEIYEKREELFAKREQEQKAMKESLSHLLDTIKQEKILLEEEAGEQKKKKEELAKQEEQLQSLYREILENKKQNDQIQKQLVEEKAAFENALAEQEIQFRVQTEQVKNDEILMRQKKEEYEHKLEMLELLLGQEGKDAGRFFESLMQEVPETDTEEEIIQLENEVVQLEKENKFLEKKQQELHEENMALVDENGKLKLVNQELKAENEALKKDSEKYEEEKKGLLGLISELKKQSAVSKSTISESTENNVPKFGTEEYRKNVSKDDKEETEEKSNVSKFDREESIDGYVPKFGKVERADKENISETDTERNEQTEVFEEMTASILEKYLKKNEAKYIASEIKHSADGEQLHVNINQLDYVFFFSQPSVFEISVKKKRSRELLRLLAKLNEEYAELKFRYDAQDGRVYATGYFSNTMTPEHLMEKVHEASDCFRQK